MTLGVDPYLVRALAEVLLAGLLGGAVGVHVLLRRLSFFTMALTHATFPGVVLAGILGLSLVLGGALFGAVVVVLLVVLTGSDRADDTSVTGVLLAGGLALGVLLLSARSGFSRDLSGYLVGSVVTVQTSDVVATAGAGVIVLLVLLAAGRPLVFLAFDRAAAEAAGYRVRVLDVVLLLLVEIAVVTSVPAVGTLQAVALLVAPAATARLWVARIGPMTLLSMALGAGSGVGGVLLSRAIDVAAGGAIVLVLAALFLASFVFAPGGPARRRERPAPGPALPATLT
jgi:ABC-type Mn2+/Zn2+ transport system permease subunit